MRTRGIEPIVAAVLLIVLAVIGAVLLYLWFAGYVSGTTSQANQLSASERLSIEAANLTWTSGRGAYAYLYIRNIGGVNSTLSTAYLLLPGSSNPLCTTNTITVYAGLSTTAGPRQTPVIPVGQDNLVYISFGPGCTVTSGYTYVVKLVTQQGSQFAVTVTAS
ncbi:archaellin/type IV pilin N-terminal domain-containing protein [Thermoproteus tenax]|uniref:Type II/IV secretion system component, FlaG family n=1 Tax=Thermoproteus tenax (strain ATCC 35583 / DSM 2078 / JCM 9277 / NBRC 100435 / Kra 1) TaxID=768679 RepID=G4RJM7_THETK|nr:archaellin/type IV pilin N-terminal domain-containing protein [Thermoproteus tenax]CCC81772.1 Type II/IV secretion system component, FlaG family [Thermoproteus tenax Kra 1]